MKLRTNLKRIKILAIKATNFQLLQKEQVSSIRLFTTTRPLTNLSSILVSNDVERYPGEKNVKIIKRSVSRINQQQRLSITFAESLEGCLWMVNMICQLKHDCIIALSSKNSRRCDRVRDHNKLFSWMYMPYFQDDHG